MGRRVAGGLARLLLLATTCVLALLHAAPIAEARNVSSLFTALFSDYDSQLRPYINTTKPVVVSTALRINLLYNVDSKEETFQLDLFVNEYWVDPRLAFDASLYSLNNTLRIPSTYTPWQPDTFFFNSVKCLTIVDSSLTLSSDGTVFWSRHQSCTFHSAFYLADFPFDSQTLAVRRTSFSYTSSELTLKFLTSSGWRPDPEEDFTNSLWDFNYAFSNTTTLSFINTDSVNAYLVVDRKWLAYVLKMVLPMFLITLLSTMSYAVDPSSPPARVSFTVALILSIVTFNTVVSADLPKINYATMIDWYVWYCFLFVVSALGEYAIVNNMTVSKKYGPEMPFLIDDFALWTAPFTWIVLNLWYWPLYNSVGVQVFLAILWSSWIGANFYRVFFWNRHQGTRGIFCKHLKTSWRRWRNPHAYEQEIAATEAAAEEESHRLDAAIELASSTDSNVFDAPIAGVGPDAPLAPSEPHADDNDLPPSPSGAPSASPGDEPNPFDDEPLLPQHDHALGDDDGPPYADEEYLHPAAGGELDYSHDGYYPPEEAYEPEQEYAPQDEETTYSSHSDAADHNPV